MPNDGDDARAVDEFLSDSRGAHAIALVITKEDPDGPITPLGASVDLVERELDSAAIHRAVVLAPWPGGAEGDARCRRPAGERRECEYRQREGHEQQSLRHRMTRIGGVPRLRRQAYPRRCAVRACNEFLHHLFTTMSRAHSPFGCC